MNFNAIVVLSLLCVSTMTLVCGSFEDEEVLHPELPIKTSLFNMVQDVKTSLKLGNDNEKVVPLNFFGRPVVAKLRLVPSDDYDKKSADSVQIMVDAIQEAMHFSLFTEFQEAELGFLSPEFITCEAGKASITDANTHSTVDYYYVVIITEMLEANMDGVNHKTKANEKKTGLREAFIEKKKGPIERLKFYLKLARSLENIHTLHKVHNDIKPENIVGDLNFMRAIFIDYDSMRAEGLTSRIKGTAKYHDLERLTASASEDVPVPQDENTAPVDIWAFALTIYEIECSLTKTDSDLIPMPSQNLVADLEKNVDKIVKQENNVCFKNSEMFETDIGKGLLVILENMLKIKRADRKIKSEEVAEQLRKLIVKFEGDFEEILYKYGEMKPTEKDGFSSLLNSEILDYKESDAIYQHDSETQKMRAII